MTTHWYTYPLVRRCVDAVRAGGTLQAVAAAEGVHHQTLSHWCRRAGVKPSSPRGRKRGTSSKYPNALRASAVAAIRSGQPLEAVARTIGVPPSTVRVWRNAA